MPQTSLGSIFAIAQSLKNNRRNPQIEADLYKQKGQSHLAETFRDDLNALDNMIQVGEPQQAIHTATMLHAKMADAGAPASSIEAVLGPRLSSATRAYFDATVKPGDPNAPEKLVFGALNTGQEGGAKAGTSLSEIGLNRQKGATSEARRQYIAGPQTQESQAHTGLYNAEKEVQGPRANYYNARAEAAGGAGGIKPEALLRYSTALSSQLNALVAKRANLLPGQDQASIDQLDKQISTIREDLAGASEAVKRAQAPRGPGATPTPEQVTGIGMSLPSGLATGPIAGEDEDMLRRHGVAIEGENGVPYGPDSGVQSATSSPPPAAAPSPVATALETLLSSRENRSPMMSTPTDNGPRPLPPLPAFTPGPAGPPVAPPGLTPSPAPTDQMAPPTAAPTPGARQPLTAELAIRFLQQAGGDKNRARQMAAQQGYTF